MAEPQRLALLGAGALAAVPALLLPLPWALPARQPVVLTGVGPAAPAVADEWSGWELAGPVVGGLLAALAAGAVVLLVARRTVAARILLVVAGATGVALGALVLVTRGTSLPAVAAVVCGLAAAGLAALGAPLVLAAALLAAAVPLLPGGPAGSDSGRTAGPFVRVAALNAGGLRGSGSLSGAHAQVIVVDGRPGVVTTGGLAVLDPAGRAEVVAETPDGPPDRPAIIGEAGGRVVRWSAADAVTVTALDPRDPVAVTVHGVGAASRLGADGTLWVRATGDPPGAARLLDLTERGGEQTADATYLPVFAIHAPAASVAVDVATLLPVARGAVRVVPQEAGYRLEQLSSTPSGRTEVTLLAGGLDAGCGLASSGAASFLPQPGPLAADGEGGIWFVTGPAPDGRLARLGPDSRLRVVAAPLPGPPSSLAVTPDGEPLLLLQNTDGPALWRLPTPAAALTDPSPPPSGCIAAPAPLAPPVTLVPAARTGRDPLGVPVGADGRWASAGRGGEIAVVAPNGARTPLGIRSDGGSGPVWPDGSGGLWWLEQAEASGATAPVHSSRSDTQRFPPVPDGASALLPDLGGRPPLLVTAAGAVRAGTGALVVGGRIGGGVVRADGRGWVLADGGLLALDGDRVIGPVIDPRDRRGDTAPVAVQLAKGVAPAALALPRATVALDRSGRAVVVADDVVLAVGDDGTVRVVAQDRRLVGLPVFAAEGGAVARDHADLLRVDLPG